MARVYLGLGSNVEAETNLLLAVRELQRRFGVPLELSPVYRNPSYGFEGDDFLNAVVGLDTDLAPEDVLRETEAIHAIAGRRRDTGKPGSRTLDIDLLLYDRLVVDRPGLHLPRKDVLHYNFVLCPLAGIAPGFVHPVTGRSLADHWRSFEIDRKNEPAARHPLTEVTLDLRGAG
jgi:2-amino-4-hydroxy-6-hydroxymethyldihydropteridine diphosphokinase